jgi:RNA polymerase sigma-70 factor (ECF subfamily)
MGILASRGQTSARDASRRGSDCHQDEKHRVSLEANSTPDLETGLIEQAQRGDREAFAALIHRYWDSLYRWLVHLTRDSHTAEDLAQETFLKAFAAVKSFRAGSNFRAWLFRIGHNNFVNQRRSIRHNRQAMPLEVEESAEGPLEETMTREMTERLQEAISKLPTDFRAALILRAEQDLSFKEIADIMGITEQTARWRVFKARQKLMSSLSPELLPNVTPPEPNQT